ncbi:MAG: hypothetical protein ACM33T_09260 [Solirubrobacterales bacterium]
MRHWSLIAAMVVLTGCAAGVDAPGRAALGPATLGPATLGQGMDRSQQPIILHIGGPGMPVLPQQIIGDEHHAQVLDGAS